MTPNRMTTVINTSDITSTMSKASNMNLKAIMALNKNIARLCELLENGARFTDDMPVKKGKRVEKRTRKKKDPNAPKRPNTAHCLTSKRWFNFSIRSMVLLRRATMDFLTSRLEWKTRLLWLDGRMR